MKRGFLVASKREVNKARDGEVLPESSGRPCKGRGHMRRLVCPMVFVAAHWALLSDPGRLRCSLPVLWSIDGGLGMDQPELTPAPASSHASKKAEALDKLLAEMEEQFKLSMFQKTCLWVFTICIWLNIAFFICVPLYLSWGTEIGLLVSRLWKRVHIGLRWFASWCPVQSFVEAACYLLALTLSVQACRYPPGPSGQAVAEIAGLLGGLAFAPCWALSSLLHAGVMEEKRDASWLSFMATAVFVPLQAAVLIPLALALVSPLVGFVAVLAVYCSLVIAVAELGPEELADGACVCLGRSLQRWVERFDAESPLQCSVAASALLTTGAMLLRVIAPPGRLAPFSFGVACMGHVAYTFGTLALASKQRGMEDTYAARQVMAVGSAGVAFLVGRVFAIRALSSTSVVFVITWLLEKEIVNRTDKVSIKIIATVFLFQFLYFNSEQFKAMFDPTGLYD